MRVEDTLARVVVEGYDFAALHRYFHDGVIHLDWDVAVDFADLTTFLLRATERPNGLRIIPYRLYKPTTAEEGWVWAHDRNPVPFGCIYLPPWILRHWRPVADGQKFNDTTLMLWLRQEYGGEASPTIIDTDLRAVHLHY